MNKSRIRFIVIGVMIGIAFSVAAIFFVSYINEEKSTTEATVPEKSGFEMKVEELTDKQFTWKDYDTKTSYEDIMRYPDEHYLDSYGFGGDVIQVVDNGDGTSFALLARDGDLDKITYIIYDNDLPDGRLLKGDNIYVFGVFGGTIDYETVGGNTETVPLIGVTRF